MRCLTRDGVDGAVEEGGRRRPAMAPTQAGVNARGRIY
jgi:hypothetical protein